MPKITKYEHDVLAKYRKELEIYPLISKEETLELVEKMKNGDKYARKDLITHNLRLVIPIAITFLWTKIDILDLIGYGNLGLITAIDNYDSSKGYLSTYATHTIFWTIHNNIKLEFPIKRTEENLKDIRLFKNAQSKLEMDLGRTPSIEEIVTQLKIPYSKVLAIYNTMKITNQYLDKSNSLEADLKLINLIVDKKSDYKEVENKHDLEILKEILRNLLTEYQYEVISSLYDLDNHGQKVEQEIANKRGTSRQAVSETKINAFIKLRRHSKIRSCATTLNIKL